MPTYKVYTSKADVENNRPILVDLGIGNSPLLPAEYQLKICQNGAFTFLAFGPDVASTDTALVIAPMLIPGYFNQVNGQDIHGMFLLSIGATANEAKAFILDKTIGQFGCPKRILKTTGKNAYFTFNRMRFYPFVGLDFSVGYFVCDHRDEVTGTQAPSYAWPDYSPAEEGVAIDYPVGFDTTLGLYTTRAAHIVRAQQAETGIAG